MTSTTAVLLITLLGIVLFSILTTLVVLDTGEFDAFTLSITVPPRERELVLDRIYALFYDDVPQERARAIIGVEGGRVLEKSGNHEFLVDVSARNAQELDDTARRLESRKEVRAVELVYR